jgi:hypothetical protein
MSLKEFVIHFIFRTNSTTLSSSAAAAGSNIDTIVPFMVPVNQQDKLHSKAYVAMAQKGAGIRMNPC